MIQTPGYGSHDHGGRDGLGDERPWHESDAFWEGTAPVLFDAERVPLRPCRQEAGCRRQEVGLDTV